MPHDTPNWSRLAHIRTNLMDPFRGPADDLRLLEVPGAAWWRTASRQVRSGMRKLLSLSWSGSGMYGHDGSMSDYFDNPEWHGCHDDNGDRLHDPLCKRSDAECRADEPPQLTEAEKVWQLIDVANAMLDEREAGLFEGTDR